MDRRRRHHRRGRGRPPARAAEEARRPQAADLLPLAGRRGSGGPCDRATDAAKRADGGRRLDGPGRMRSETAARTCVRQAQALGPRLGGGARYRPLDVQFRLRIRAGRRHRARGGGRGPARGSFRGDLLHGQAHRRPRARDDHADPRGAGGRTQRAGERLRDDLRLSARGGHLPGPAGGVAQRRVQPAAPPHPRRTRRLRHRPPRNRGRHVVVRRPDRWPECPQGHRGETCRRVSQGLLEPDLPECVHDPAALRS